MFIFDNDNRIIKYFYKQNLDISNNKPGITNNNNIVNNENKFSRNIDKYDNSNIDKDDNNNDIKMKLKTK